MELYVEREMEVRLTVTHLSARLQAYVGSSPIHGPEVVFNPAGHVAGSEGPNHEMIPIIAQTH